MKVHYIKEDLYLKKLKNQKINKSNEPQKNNSKKISD